MSFRYIFLFTITAIIVAGLIFRNNIPNVIKSIFTPVSIVSNAITTTELKNTDGRTNFLLLGIDSRDGNPSITSGLTDTIIVLSVDKEGQNPVLISIPRDLWVETPQIQGLKGTKINGVYPITRAQCIANITGRADDEAKKACAEEAISSTEAMAEQVVGIPIHYHVLVGFDIFTESIDSVDGIEVVVDEAFDDYQYPIEGMEDAPNEADRYQHIHFDGGRQIMDGETALKFARSRHSTNPNEAGDFARARRQQKVIVALKDKILSTKTLFSPTKLKELYNTYQDNVVTNLTLSEYRLLYTNYSDVDVGSVSQIVLSDEATNDLLLGSGTLGTPEVEERDAKYDGLYVLVPTDRTFDNIHALIRTNLFK